MGKYCWDGNTCNDASKPADCSEMQSRSSRQVVAGGSDEQVGQKCFLKEAFTGDGGAIHISGSSKSIHIEATTFKQNKVKTTTGGAACVVSTTGDCALEAGEGRCFTEANSWELGCSPSEGRGGAILVNGVANVHATTVNITTSAFVRNWSLN